MKVVFFFPSRRRHTSLVPYGRIADRDFAARRQAGLADPPALHFPPIEPGRWKFDRRYPDGTSILAAQNSNRSSGCLSTGAEHPSIRTTDKPLSDVGLVVAKNGRFGRGMQPFERCVAIMHDARRIDNHRFPQDGGMRWRRSHMLQNLFKR